jgi:hypothetical protein
MEGDDEVDEDEDEDEQNAWKVLIDQAYDQHQKLYQDRVAALEKEGVDEKEIETQVTDALMPLYRKSLINIYKKYMVQMHDLSTNPYHREIMQSLNWYLQWKGFSFDRALDITIRKKRGLFEDILDAEEEQLRDQSDENMDSDSESEAESEVETEGESDAETDEEEEAA